ncbi:Low molecular weight protein-tyrosine-phosphatase Wzb [Roseibaca ekhonensis]|uniref:protein-tyrosine-phosphatase n=1 Tax=Roseinatronobacter ekhonensis TaxID=254356 RepID=A0A3B0M9C2_9RHOB|nr:Low molecular weight protein-tyrosine-phosphatase Wzb [Roseibaca ekhonensis]
MRAALDGTTKRPAEVSSAGLHALVGHGIDADTAAAARTREIPLHDHAARQFDTALGQNCDVILVMETHHRQEIAQRWPQFLGKTFLLGHFDAARQVPDPYRQAMGMHAQAVEIILQCSESWAIQLRQTIT